MASCLMMIGQLCLLWVSHELNKNISEQVGINLTMVCSMNRKQEICLRKSQHKLQQMGKELWMRQNGLVVRLEEKA